MSNGNVYHILPIASIKVGERFREKISDLHELKESIFAHGLFHAIVIDRDYNLLAGGRRLAACNELNYEEIYCRFVDECDPLTAREIELEENLARENLSWQDEDRLRTEIDRLKRAKYGSSISVRLENRGGTVSSGGWTSADTAQSLGISSATVSRSIARVEAMNYVPSIASAPTRKAADRELDRFIQDLETELNLRRRNHESLAISKHLFLDDCIASLAKMSAASVDLLITDPPYAIAMNTAVGNTHRTRVEYEDDPASILPLLRTAFSECHRVLKPNGHAYVFCSSVPADTLRISDLLSSAGFDVDPIPLIWHKDSHGTVDWDYRYAPCYETILFCSNRQRRLTTKRENLFHSNNDLDRIHTAQKPVELLLQFISQSSVSGEIVLDPFMGSGSTIVAAIRSSRRYIGMEISPAAFGAAKVRIMNELARASEKELL